MEHIYIYIYIYIYTYLCVIIYVYTIKKKNNISTLPRHLLACPAQWRTCDQSFAPRGCQRTVGRFSQEEPYPRIAKWFAIERLSPGSNTHGKLEILFRGVDHENEYIWIVGMEPNGFKLHSKLQEGMTASNRTGAQKGFPAFPLPTCFCVDCV